MDIDSLRDAAESASRQYAEHASIARTDDWLILKLNEEVGELTQAYLARAGQARDRGRSVGQLDDAFRAELADVLGQVLLIAHRFDVDLGAELERKWLSRE